jgi:hypothetical protein
MTSAPGGLELFNPRVMNLRVMDLRVISDGLIAALKKRGCGKSLIPLQVL